MSKKYQGRVSDLIQSHLTQLLEKKVNDPRLGEVNITDVTVTPDLAKAHVYFSVLGDAEAQQVALESLERAGGWLRHELGQSLRLRNIPELVFHWDPSLEYGDRIAHILDGLQRDDEPEEPELDASTPRGE